MKTHFRFLIASLTLSLFLVIGFAVAVSLSTQAAPAAIINGTTTADDNALEV